MEKEYEILTKQFSMTIKRVNILEAAYEKISSIPKQFGLYVIVDLENIPIVKFLSKKKQRSTTIYKCYFDLEMNFKSVTFSIIDPEYHIIYRTTIEDKDITEIKRMEGINSEFLENLAVLTTYLANLLKAYVGDIST